MRAVLFTVGVLGLAAVFALSEPAPASAKPVISDDVRLVSEQMSIRDALQVYPGGRNGTGVRAHRIR